MRKLICCLLLILMLLPFAVLAEEAVPDLTGSWRFIGGGEMLGYGFTLRPDGTGNFLTSEDEAVFPQRHLHETDDAPFAWQAAPGESGALYLTLTYGDGHTAAYPVMLEGDELSVTEDDPEFLGGGGYERYDEAALRAWADAAEDTPLTEAIREYLADQIEARLPGLGLRSPEVWVRPAEEGYTFAIDTVVNDIIWTVHAEMDGTETRVDWRPLNPSSAAPEAEGGFAVWTPDVPLQGVLQSAVDSAHRAVAEAQRSGAPEEIPQLTGREIRWKQGKACPVYQGPGVDYGRAAAGKAVVATGAPFTAYGVWKGALLIRYEISQGHDRFGWILPEDAPAGAIDGLETLPFVRDSAEMDYRLGVLTQVQELTDDPGKSKASSGRLAAGSSVHCLALYGDWMLVEGFSGGKLAMGFVPAELVDREHGFTANAQYIIDRAATYTEPEIRAAMEKVTQEIHDHWAGTNLLRLKYKEAESNEEANWYADKGMQCMILFADLNDMGLYDYEISGEVAGDYEFVVRRLPGGDWEVCNWGYR